MGGIGGEQTTGGLLDGDPAEGPHPDRGGHDRGEETPGDGDPSAPPSTRQRSRMSPRPSARVPVHLSLAHARTSALPASAG